MAVPVVFRSRFSTSARELLDEWETALRLVTDDEIRDALGAFCEAGAVHVRQSGSSSAFVDGVLIIDYPPYLELAMREVLATLRRRWPSDVVARRIDTMTRLLVPARGA